MYVSKLRRLLSDGTGEEVLSTRAPGYVLHVPAESLDTRRFEQLLERGRQALADGDPENAAATLREALSLWRGTPLSDLTYERFAQAEIARLEELRLTALEERIEAELALGRHGALVAELEALVAAHPYRERLRAQLMLVLYRTGRQAEALAAYQLARRTFVDELGIEPSPRLQELERAILRHDPALDAPAPEAASLSREREPSSRRRSRRLPVLLAGFVLVVAAAAAALLFSRDGSTEQPKPVALVGDSVAVIDPETNAIVAEVPVGGRPTGIAVGEGSVWVGNRDDHTLLRIDPETRKVVRTFGLNAEPDKVVAGAGSVWVAMPGAVLQIDPDVNDVVASLPITCCPPPRAIHAIMAAGPEAVWLAHRLALYRIDPQTSAMKRLRDGGVHTIAYGEGALWAATGAGLQAKRIEKLDPRTGAVLASLSLEGTGTTEAGPAGMAVGDGAVWAGKDFRLWRVDAVTTRLTDVFPLGRLPAGVAIGNGAVWLASYDGFVRRLDPRTGRVLKTIALGVVPAYVWNVIAVGEGAVWVATERL